MFWLIRVRYASQFVTHGQKFIHNHMTLSLYCIRRTKPSAPVNEALPDDLDALPLLDGSGSYALHASVLVMDGKNANQVNKAMSELKVLQNTLRGCIELKAPDRLSMNTVIR